MLLFSLIASLTVAASAQQPSPVDLVDALNGLFGKHAGDRAAHTKGICLTRTFAPSADASKLSKAAHFAKKVPIRARFSLGGGNPNAPQGWFLGIHCFTKYVKVAFFRGTSLRPVPPGKSKDKYTRYLDIHEDEQLDEELVASWIRQASELPGWVP